MTDITPKWKFLSGSAIKLIAMITMLIDHAAAFLLYNFEFMNAALVTVLGKEITAYYIFRTVGRLAFPLYCFLLSEGFSHTKSHKKYIINLFVFALLSEIPWNLAHTGTLLYSKQNIFFTLLLGYLALYFIEKFKSKPLFQIVSVVALFGLSLVIRADYGNMGFIAVITMHVLRNNPLPRAIIFPCLLSSRFRAALAFIPIALYNGKRGFIRGKLGKYICYAFYPIHILIIALIRIFLVK